VIGSSRPAAAGAVLVAWLIAPGLGAQTPQALLDRYKCYSCHSEREVRTGPAFVDVASTYRGDPRAAAMLMATVRNGAHGAGPWHMPPHPEVSDKDARMIVEYILSLRP
jgi:cytochrome c